MSFTIEITSEMKRQFRSETTEHLNGFEKMLMVIEKDPGNQEAIHSAFREIHSLKGNSDYLGIKDINTLAHGLEDLMDDIRSGRVNVVGTVLDILFEGLDLLRDMNRRVVNADYEESDISPICERIRFAKMQSGQEPEPQAAAPADSGFVTDPLEEEIKVGLEKIDLFMSHVSELTTIKNRLNYLTEEMISPENASGWMDEIKKTAFNINRLVNDIHDDVMKLRLVRMNALFERLPRIVRELSHKSGKKAELKFSGGETEIDRKIIEKLIDPLIHLIRNSVDHGIEFPEERISKGKPASGIIVISAYQEGNHAVIDVSDNGKGLNIDKIRKEALKRNIISENMADDLSERHIKELVFTPGFSTLSRATEISGRGVGLDVVRNNIKAIGGTITLSSEKNTGTRVRVRIPVSMSVTDILLTEVCGRKYAFPFSCIRKTLRIQTKDIKGPGTARFIAFEDTVLPIKFLKDILEIQEECQTYSLAEGAKPIFIRSAFQHSGKEADGELSVIVINSGKQLRGLVVDNILKRESVLIKPLENYLAGIKEFSGTVILGDGSVVLVADPLGMC
jgi:two-component system chemotaxis sensor kinase CheA